MSGGSPLVSVVTPFYNTAALLARCIESVLGQTRGDFEYVLVDNCSTDGSRQIAEEYARKDARIRFFANSSFLSQVGNYNGSLERISGATRYVKIVQADDWLFPRCLADMTDLAERHPRIGIVSSLDMRGHRVRGAGLPPEQCVLTGRETGRLVLAEGVFLFGSPTTVMYRADIVRARRPFFAEGHYHEDTEACFEILEGCDFGFVHQVLSCITVREESIMGNARTFDPEELDKLIRVLRYGRRFLDGPEYERCAREAWHVYYRHLAAAWLHRRERAYWDYHRQGLATVGEVIDRRKLAREIVVEAVALATPSGLRGGVLRAAVSRLLRPGNRRGPSPDH